MLMTGEGVLKVPPLKQKHAREGLAPCKKHNWPQRIPVFELQEL